MNQEELDLVLSNFVSDEQLWQTYRSLFDNQLSKDNLNVSYLRSQMTSAGPIKDGDIRYNNVKDRKSEQYAVAKDFSKRIRELS